MRRHNFGGIARFLCIYAPRKILSAFLLVFIASVIALIVFSCSQLYQLPLEDSMALQIAAMKNRLLYVEAMFRQRQEDVMDMQGRLLIQANNQQTTGAEAPTPAEILALVDSIPGTKTASGLNPKEDLPKKAFVHQLMPHLLDDPHSLRPAYHMKGNRTAVEMVIGIPTVKRDKDSYLMTTLKHLITGIEDVDLQQTVIVIFVGELDLKFVIKTAREIEIAYPQHVKNGLIEVLSPSSSYYPFLGNITPTLGDSIKRSKWRTKQNLDTMYLMAYSQSKGTFYLMLEDDVVASPNYMKVIKRYTTQTTVTTPDWFYIEYCAQGGIGKLFRSSDLFHFITYVQLFYSNMPIDWLLESYLADKVCSINKGSKECAQNKLEIRPKFKVALFSHIGLYSSLKGKIQLVNKNQLNFFPIFFPHKNNPPVRKLYTDIPLLSPNHSLENAYHGKNFFWGFKPKKGNVVEIWFEEPTDVKRFTFRTGNIQHKNDKLSATVVEVLPYKADNFTMIGEFDEFGLADDEVPSELSPLSAIRLRVMKDGRYWVVINEIDIKQPDAYAR